MAVDQGMEQLLSKQPLFGDIMSMKKTRFLGIISVTAVFMPVIALATLEGSVLVGYSLGYDDNIGGGSESQSTVEDISNELYLNVDVAKTTGFLRYDVFGRAGFIARSSDILEDEFRFSGGLNGLWIIQPSRLTWRVSDVATVRRRNARELTSSGNTEQSNFFETGPSLSFRPTGRTAIDLNANYQQSWFEFGDSNEYVSASISGSYTPSELSRFSGSYSEVYFLPDTNLSSDSVSRSASVRFDRRLQRGSWFIGAGTSQVTLDEQIVGENDDVIPTYTAGFNYQVARQVVFDISAGRQVVTIGQDTLARSNQRSLALGLNNSNAVPNRELTPIELNRLRNEVDQFDYGAGFNVNETLQAGLTWQDGRWGVSARVYATKLEVPEFELNLSQEARALLFPSGTLDSNQESQGVSFLVTLEPRIRWLANLGLRIEDRSLDAIDVLAADPNQNIVTTELRETIFSTGLTFAATRNLSFGGNLESALLQDKSGVVDNVRNNGVFLTVEYSL